MHSSLEEIGKTDSAKVITTEISGNGINLNGGARWKYARVGLDIASTIGNAELSGSLALLAFGGDKIFKDSSVARYSIEGAGIIPIGEKFELEIGLSFGRAIVDIDAPGTDPTSATPVGFFYRRIV